MTGFHHCMVAWLFFFLGMMADCRAQDEVKTPAAAGFVGTTASFLASGHYPVKTENLDAGFQSGSFIRRARILDVSAPGELTQSDTEYRLITDIAADGTAFVIKASQVTLNLNGHTITYHQKPAATNVHGVLIPGYNKKDIAIVNGRIIEGSGGGAPASHPIYDYDAGNIEVSGLEIEYTSPDTSAIEFNWVSNAIIHHNTIQDKGSKVSNRHQGVAVIEANRGGKGSKFEIHHNVVYGARHNGIRAGVDSNIYNNEVNISSVVTNSTGISASGNIFRNRVLGAGVHPIGIWPGSNVKVYANYVEVQNTAKGEEYSDTGASCLRMTWGNDNVEVMNNTFILHAEDNSQQNGVRSWGRALWVGLPKPEQKASFHDNLIVALNNDGKAKAAAVAIVCLNESPHLEFRHNVIISNWGNILLADSYGHAGGFARFAGNRIIREGSADNYRTILSQYAAGPSTAVLIDNSFENGASLDALGLEFDGKALKELAIGWRLQVSASDSKGPISGARVEVADKNGTPVFSGITGSDGTLTVEIVSYLLTNRDESGKPLTAARLFAGKGNRIEKSPHTVTVVNGEQRKTATVNVEGNREAAFTF